jgi:magnesium-protoporphyrin O-methyltransferase
LPWKPDRKLATLPFSASPEVPGLPGLEGGLQNPLRSLEPSFEAASPHLRMRGMVGSVGFPARLSG